MKSLTINFVLLLVSMQMTACSKKTASKEASASSNDQIVESKPFKSEVYRAFDGSKKITLVSSDELEMTERDMNIICKYTKQDDGRLRVVANIVGTTQALYYKITPQGLQAQDGLILFSSAGYLQEKENREKERQRIQMAMQQSRKPTKEIAKFSGKVENPRLHDAYDYVKLTDVSFIVHRFPQQGERYSPPEVQEIFFSEITDIKPIQTFRKGQQITDSFSILAPEHGLYWGVGTSNLPEVKTFYVMLLKAYREWGNKYPELKKVYDYPAFKQVLE